MSLDEYSNLMKSRTWSSNEIMEGKWFAESYKDAVTWGKTMGHGGDFLVIQVKVPDSVADDAFSKTNLDNIGKAKYIEINELNKAKVKPKWSRHVSC